MEIIKDNFVSILPHFLETNWLYLEGPKKVTSFKQPNPNPNSVLEFTKDNFVSFLPHFLETKSVVIFGKSKKGYFFQATKLEPENQSFIRYRSRVFVLEFTKDNFISFHSHFWETKWSCLEGLKKGYFFQATKLEPENQRLIRYRSRGYKISEAPTDPPFAITAKFGEQLVCLLCSLLPVPPDTC